MIKYKTNLKTSEYNFKIADEVRINKKDEILFRNIISKYNWDF